MWLEIDLRRQMACSGNVLLTKLRQWPFGSCYNRLSPVTLMSRIAQRTSHILCVSWDPGLATTREHLLAHYGYKVTSALGPEQSMERCSTKADLLLLGHSVPRKEKQRILDCFRKFNLAPALSLVAPGQEKLPDVEYWAEILDPERLVKTLQSIVPPHRSYAL